MLAFRQLVPLTICTDPFFVTSQIHYVWTLFSRVTLEKRKNKSTQNYVNCHQKKKLTYKPVCQNTVTMALSRTIVTSKFSRRMKEQLLKVLASQKNHIGHPHSTLVISPRINTKLSQLVTCQRVRRLAETSLRIFRFSLL